MASSFVQGTFDGTTDQINLTYGYLDKSHVFVYLSGVLQEVDTDYVWNSDAQIEILGGNPADGTPYLAQRQTPTSLIAEFQPGNIDTTDLNFSFLQAIYVAEEAKDAVALGYTSFEGVTGRTISSLGATSGTFAVFDDEGNLVPSEDWGDGDLSGLAGYVTAAQGFATAASTSAGLAAGYAAAASGFKDDSEASALAAAASAIAAAASAADAVASVKTTLEGLPLKSSPVAADKTPIIDSVDGELRMVSIEEIMRLAGPPIGTVIDVYGNGTSSIPGYLKVIPGLEITSAYPQLRAFGLSDGWAVNGSGNPVMPNSDALFKRGWASGQTRDAGRLFGSVQEDALQNVTGQVGGVVQGGTVASGPFLNGTVVGGGYGGGGGAVNNVSFDLSRVARTASETRVANMTVTHYIRAYGGPVDAGTIAAAEVLDDLADARARLVLVESYHVAGNLGLTAINDFDFDVLRPGPVKRIVLTLAQFTTNGASVPMIQMKVGGAPETSGYTGGAGNTSTTTPLANSTGFFLNIGWVASSLYDVHIELIKGPSNNWVMSSTLGISGGAATAGGSKQLAGEATGIRLRMLNGTDVPDATVPYSLYVEYE